MILKKQEIKGELEINGVKKEVLAAIHIYSVGTQITYTFLFNFLHAKNL